MLCDCRAGALFAMVCDPRPDGMRLTALASRPRCAPEHTVVNSAEPGGAADRAGVVASSLLLAVGDDETLNMTHEEVIARLKQPARPLRVRLRRLAPQVLTVAREKMRSLVELSSAARWVVRARRMAAEKTNAQ